ncbi:hypothetical protein [Bradyrhizobium sp. AZCC 1610]|uniref:hypothetical protein n=1 Tax=Bradyrhizobium sp. AZCC 1610 TaxID=3117020 RepID=UPI002FEF1855
MSCTNIARYTDIANYLVINCDTLSHAVMRFCDCGLIERESRHGIRIIDVNVAENAISSRIAPVGNV